MKVYKINDKKYNIPESWDEMTLRQYLMLSEFVRLHNQSEVDDINPVFFYNRVFKCITDDKVDLNEVDKDIVMGFAEALKFTEKPPQSAQSTYIETKNTTVRPKNFETMTFGEFVDLQTFAASQTIENQLKMFASIVDVYEKPNYLKLRFRKRLKKFKHDEKIDYVSSLPATKLKTIQDFFLHGQRRYVRNMALSLEVQALRLNMKALLRVASVGIYLLWKRVKTILPKWMK